MNVVRADSPLPTSSPFNEYRVGDVDVVDRTNGVMQIVFLPELMEQFLVPTYGVLIKGEPLLYPMNSCFDRKYKMCLIGSQQITFEFFGRYIKVVESKQDVEKTFYVDSQKSLEKISPCCPNVHSVYSFVPACVNVRKAREDVEKIKAIYAQMPSSFDIQHVAYNSHGTAVIAVNQDTKNFFLFWAHPVEEELKVIENMSFICVEGRSFFVGRSEKIWCEYFVEEDECYLNGRLATPIKDLCE